MGTVTKALELLDLFTRQRPHIGLSDLARLSGQNKTTCFRLASDLLAYGLIEQDTTTREYRLGPAALRLAALREAAVPMRDASLPIVEQLAMDTGESAHSSVLVGDRLQLMDYAYSPRHATRVVFDDTDFLPFHATASGIAALAYLPEAQRLRIVRQPLAPVTPQTETNPDRVLLTLQKVRAQGYATIDGGFETDVFGSAAPVFGRSGACLGALAVAAPSSRMTDTLQAEILRALVTAARHVTTLWGGTLPPDIGPLWEQIIAGKDIS